MSFGINPTTGFNPPAEDDFPQFIQFQDEGVPLGGPDADTVNFVGAGVTVTRGAGESENVITVEIDGGGAPSTDFWRVVPGIGNLQSEDVGNGILMTATTGGPTLNIGGGIIGPGQTVLVAAVSDGTPILTADGVTFVISPRFQAKVNPNGGTVTLIGLPNGSILICGDLVAA